MTNLTSYHQLGKFIAWFQAAESEINRIIELLANNTDSEVVSILINGLEYSKRLDTADVMFARFVDVYQPDNSTGKTKFHKLIGKLKKLGERRNELVHSNYISWQNVEGSKGLIREHSKLRGSKGLREETEEELLPEAFNKDLEQIDGILYELNEFRLKIIDWLYPELDDV